MEIASGYPHKETKGSFNKITTQPSKGAHPQGSPSEVVHGDASPRGVCVGGGQRGPRGHPLSHPPRSGGICEFRDYGAHVHPKAMLGGWAAMGRFGVPAHDLLPAPEAWTHTEGTVSLLSWGWRHQRQMLGPGRPFLGAPRGSGLFTWAGTQKLGSWGAGGRGGGICTGEDNMVPGQRPGIGAVQAVSGQQGLGVPGGGQTPCPTPPRPAPPSLPGKPGRLLFLQPTRAGGVT